MTSSKPSETKPAVNRPVSFEALGTTWWIYFQNVVLKGPTLNVMGTIVSQFERRYSRFLDDSLISQLNRDKKLVDPPEELVEMLQFAVHMSQQTEGLFNLTAGTRLADAGYGPDMYGNYQKDWTKHVHIETNVIRIDDELSLDLGGFGKGWLVDLLFSHLQKEGAINVLVNGGGDIRLNNPDKQQIPLMLPGDSSKFFTKAEFSSGALASSSPLLRAWGKHNHLVDAEGQSYTGDTTQLTVFAASARLADASATACIISPDPFKLATQLGVEILITKKDGTYEASSKFPLVR